MGQDREGGVAQRGSSAFQCRRLDARTRSPLTVIPRGPESARPGQLTAMPVQKAAGLHFDVHRWVAARAGYSVRPPAKL